MNEQRSGAWAQRVAGVVALTAVLAACEVFPGAAPTPDVVATVDSMLESRMAAPTPNVEATVDARVEERLGQAAGPTPDIVATVDALVAARLASRESSSSEGSAGLPPAVPPSPAPTPTPARTPDLSLRSQLPVAMYEEFVDSFYAGCSEPPFDDLGVVRTWSGSGDSRIEFPAPSGTYFLALVADPVEGEWRFDSVLESASGRRFQSLQVGSTVPDDLTSAQEWCGRGGGLLGDALHIESAGLAWTVYLVGTSGENPIPRDAVRALSGYYGACPAQPPIESLKAIVLASGEGPATASFTFSPPYYFLGVLFEPVESEWAFQSVVASGDWTGSGPALTSGAGERIDFQARCPQTAGSHRLEVASFGGHWTVYVIGVVQ